MVASATSFSGTLINFNNITFTDGYYTIGRIDNVITNSITSNQTISCGSTPATLTGGTVASATYQWQLSTDSLAWSNVSTGGTSANYTPPALGITTWYRRSVTVSSCNNISNVIKITVTSSSATNSIILNNPSNATICYNTSPGLIKTNGTALGTSFTYQWYKKVESGSWTIISGATAETYTPSVLTTSTSFRRTNTTSTAPFCGSNSNEVLITVKPIVAKQGPILGPESVCKNSNDNVYEIANTEGATYTWTYSGTGATIIDEDSISAITVYYGPTATSGSWTVVMHYMGCSSVASDPLYVALKNIPSINTVTDKQYCAGVTVPAIPLSGSGATSYTWTNSNTAIGLAATGSGNIPAFTATNTGTTAIVSTITIRAFNTTTDCYSVSKTFTITIHPKPNGTISLVDDDICVGTNAQLIFTATAGTGPFSLIINSITYPGISTSSPFSITPTPLVPTIYNLTKITDSKGCVR